MEQTENTIWESQVSQNFWNYVPEMRKLLGKIDPEVCILVPLKLYLSVRLHVHRLKQRQACQRIIQEITDLNSLEVFPGSGRSPGEGNGNPLQYSCLENPMDRRAWQANSLWGCKESDMAE